MGVSLAVPCVQLCVIVGAKPTRPSFTALMKTAGTTLFQTLSEVVPAAVPVSRQECCSTSVFEAAPHG
jgi:hypothetical protein